MWCAALAAGGEEVTEPDADVAAAVKDLTERVEDPDFPTEKLRRHTIQTVLARLRALEARAEEAEKERDELIGLSAGRNTGPYPACSDCGRRMIWSDRDGPSPAWMCPECVYQELRGGE